MVRPVSVAPAEVGPNSEPVEDIEPARRRRAVAWFTSLGPVGRGFAAFIMYAVVSVAAYGHTALPHFASRCTTMCLPDTKYYIWSLEWMAYALSHGLNPFHTDHLSAPGGVDLTWVVTIPGPALVVAPVTLLFGPVASDNLLLLAAPALAGWAAYLVCVRVTRRFWPSVAGGFVFGFSAYMTLYIRAELHALLVFPAALAVYLVIRRVEGSMKRPVFVALLVLVLAFQLFTSGEGLASMTLFGAIAIVGALLFGSRTLRERLLPTTGLIALAYVIVATVTSPYLIETFRHPPSRSIRDSVKHSSDLLSFVLPHRDAWIGGETFAGTTHGFVGDNAMDYLGPVLILILFLFAWTFWRRRSTWLLLAFAATVAVLSLGPRLHVGGTESIVMPGALITRLPIMKHSVPERWVVYLWLTVAVIAALWVGAGRRRTGWVRYVVLGLAMILTIQKVAPALNYPPAPTSLAVPAFFTEGTYRSYIQPGEVVLPVTKNQGDDHLWQAETSMYFRMPQGSWPLVRLASGRKHIRSWIHPSRSPHRVVRPPTLVALRAFLEQHRVQAIVAANPLPPAWAAVLRSTVSRKPVSVGGVSIYRPEFGIHAGPGEVLFANPCCKRH